jgi:hypothetical protein
MDPLSEVIKCGPNVDMNADSIALLIAIDMRSNEIEKWVKALAIVAFARLGWCFRAGMIRLVHEGSEESRRTVIAVLRALPHNPNKGIVVSQIFD